MTNEVLSLKPRGESTDAIERLYDVAPDGKRFVVIRGNATGKSDVVLAEEWLPGEAPKGQD